MKYIIYSVLVTHVFMSCAKDVPGKAQKFLKHTTEEKVSFEARESLLSDKKITRRGLLTINPRAAATVLICHGFMCDKFDINFLRLMFKDYNCMTFDFRAHGEESDGQCCTFGRDEAYDVIGAARFIKNHPLIKNKPLFVYGFSMGAVASILAQAQDHTLFTGMVLDCPFDSTDKLLERGISHLKINIFGYEMAIPGSSLLKSYAYSPYIQSLLKAILKTISKMDATQVNTCICPVYPEEAVRYVTVPCFIIGCVKDDKATEEAVMSVYTNSVSCYKRLWMTEGRRHFDSVFYRMDDYFHKVNRFIKNCLQKKLMDKKPAKITHDPGALTPDKKLVESAAAAPLGKLLT